MPIVSHFNEPINRILRKDRKTDSLKGLLVFPRHVTHSQIPICILLPTLNSLTFQRHTSMSGNNLECLFNRQKYPLVGLYGKPTLNVVCIELGDLKKYRSQMSCQCSIADGSGCNTERSVHICSQKTIALWYTIFIQVENLNLGNLGKYMYTSRTQCLDRSHRKWRPKAN